jgi:hypothetical protein
MQHAIKMNTRNSGFVTRSIIQKTMQVRVVIAEDGIEPDGILVGFIGDVGFCLSSRFSTTTRFI